VKLFCCHRWLVVALLLLHAAMVAWIGWRTSITVDEVGHLPAGIYVWQFGRYDVYRVNPPLVRTNTTNYTTMTELLRSPLTETPNEVRRFAEFVPPVVYNWSIGVQREIGWKIVADAAYVANAARRQQITRELNGRPYGYAYQPSSLDTTNIQGAQQKPQPLPDDLLRPYRGYASILQREFTGYADYHSLQVSLNRRRSTEGLTFGAAYTYQIVNKTLGAIDPFLPDNRARNYNSAGRRPHTFTVHYSYQVPPLARTAHQVWRALADNWQLGVVASFVSDDHFIIPLDGVDQVVALNAPKRKGTATLNYRSLQNGWNGELRVRHNAAFPVNSAGYVGMRGCVDFDFGDAVLNEECVQSFNIVDVGVGYRIPQLRGASVQLYVQNVLDEDFRAFVGTPTIGRMAVLRLKYDF
jgi:hypothetical protein